MKNQICLYELEHTLSYCDNLLFLDNVERKSIVSCVDQYTFPVFFIKYNYKNSVAILENTPGLQDLINKIEKKYKINRNLLIPEICIYYEPIEEARNYFKRKKENGEKYYLPTDEIFLYIRIGIDSNSKEWENLSESRKDKIIDIMSGLDKKRDLILSFNRFYKKIELFCRWFNYLYFIKNGMTCLEELEEYNRNDNIREKGFENYLLSIKESCSLSKLKRLHRQTLQMFKDYKDLEV